MKNIISNTKFMYFYLKGVVQFRAKNYSSAELFFEKAIHYDQGRDNELHCQYYGQTLLASNKIDEAYVYLSKSYKIYEKKGWSVSDDEEYRLAKNTLDALKYIDDNYALKIDNVVYDKEINRQ